MSEPRGTPSDHTYIYNFASAYHGSWLFCDNTFKKCNISHIYRVQGVSLSQNANTMVICYRVYSNLQKKDQDKQESDGVKVNIAAQNPDPLTQQGTLVLSVSFTTICL